MSEEFNKQLAGVPKKYADNILEILYTEQDIAKMVDDVASRINADYADSDCIVVVGLLKGCYNFTADLTRKLTVPHVLDFIVVSSYNGGTDTSGTITMTKDLTMNVEGKHILIIEDLIDTGTTLAWVSKHLETKNPASVSVACLLNKEERRIKSNDIPVKYVGTVVPDKFVVGYGMDFKEEYRSLPFVGVLKPSAYKK